MKRFLSYFSFLRDFCLQPQLLTKPPRNQFPPVLSPAINSIQPAPRFSVASEEFLLERI
jgi:hypothetical protein